MKTAILSTLFLLAIIGCGAPKPTTVVKDDKGNTITTEQGSDGQVNVKSSDGSELHMGKDGWSMTDKTGKESSAVGGTGLISEGELGLPFYPGSEPVTGRDIKASQNGETTRLSVRTTKDSPEKVIEFYAPKITDCARSSMEKVSTATGKLGDGKCSVMAMVVDSGTEISVTTTLKK